VERVPEDDGLAHRRRVVHVATPNLRGMYVPFAHHDCVHNQLIAIHNRVCGQVPRPTASGLTAMRAGAQLLAESLPRTVQEPLGQFALKYGGKKRDRYLQAVEHVVDNGLSRRDSTVTMFVKCEKMSPDKNNPDPRAIQFRDPKYCVVLASFLKPIEEHLYRLKIRSIPNISSTRLVGKGLNQIQRAELLVQKYSRFRSPVCVTLDMSRFDQHVDVEALKIEHSVYHHSNNDSWFRQLLSWQLRNTVHSRKGFKYTTLGKRMSGDMNTALGNCVIMLSMVLGWMVPKGIPFDVFDDGDDCLLIVEESELEVVLSEVHPFFLSCGHEAKIEKIAYSPQQVSWCQSSPIRTADGWKFVRDYRKVLSTCLVGTRWLVNSHKTRLAYLAGLGECELTLNVGVPVLQEFAVALLRNSRGFAPRFDTSSGEWHRYLLEARTIKNVTPQIVTDEARSDFMLAFGLSIQDQIDYESALRVWDFQLETSRVHFVSWDPETWTDLRFGHEEFQ